MLSDPLMHCGLGALSTRVLVTHLKALMTSLGAQVAFHTFLLEATIAQPDSKEQGKTESHDERQPKCLVHTLIENMFFNFDFILRQGLL